MGRQTTVQGSREGALEGAPGFPRQSQFIHRVARQLVPRHEKSCSSGWASSPRCSTATIGSSAGTSSRRWPRWLASTCTGSGERCGSGAALTSLEVERHMHTRQGKRMSSSPRMFWRDIRPRDQEHSQSLPVTPRTRGPLQRQMSASVWFLFLRVSTGQLHGFDRLPRARWASGQSGSL